MKEPLRVKFSAFWPGFEPNAFFIPWISSTLERPVLVSDWRRPDLVVESIFHKKGLIRSFGNRFRSFSSSPKAFGRRPSERSRPLKVWFTGENVRPPIEGYDLSLSFDGQLPEGRNQYLPLIVTGLDWFQNEAAAKSLEARRTGGLALPADVAKPRRADVSSRTGFACAFIGNLEPTRMRAINALAEVGEVHLFGPGVGRPVPDKVSIAKDYKFMVCFENDLYPGYITEKPLDAWIAGCVPLWWGIDRFRLLNPHSHVNLDSFPSISEFVQEVRRLNANRDELDWMAGRGLFSSEPQLDVISNALRDLFI